MNNKFKILTIIMISCLYSNCISAIAMEDMDIDCDLNSNTNFPSQNTSSSANKNINSIPINITTCKTLEHILSNLYIENNKKYGESEDNITYNSGVVLQNARTFTAAVRQMINYPSKRNIIQCYRKLLHLQPVTYDLRITDDNNIKKQINLMYKAFIPFKEYVINNVYPRIYEETIDINPIIATRFTIGNLHKNDKSAYVISSILPQLDAVIEKAKSVNNSIVSLQHSIKLFKNELDKYQQTLEITQCYNVYWKGLNSMRKKVTDILLKLHRSTICKKGVIAVSIEDCEELINSIKELLSKYVYKSTSKEMLVVNTQQLIDLARSINLYSSKIRIDFASYAAYLEEANNRIKYYKDEVNKNKNGN